MWLRSRTAQLVVLVVIFSLGIGAAALAESGPLQDILSSSNSTDTSTDGGSSDTKSLIVKLVAGLSASEQADAITRHGGTETDAVAPLRLHVVSVASDEADSALEAYRADPQVARAELDKTREAEATPSDPGYDSQWALDKIGWASVFDAGAPSGSAKIAVLDTGVSSADGDMTIGSGWSAFGGGDPTSDPNGHGTAVASIAAAAADNAKGIAGVSFAGTTVLPVQVLNSDGLGQDSDIIEGVVWAADHGADVILMSFSNPGYSPALQDAIDYAWERGAVVVAATGNDGSGEPTYPAGDAKVVGVSGTTDADELWSESNYGADAFIAAPAVGVTADATDGTTTSISGTSASAAFVAGAAALLKASDSSASNGVILGRLARSAAVAGSQEQTGNGRLDVAGAMADTGTDAVVPAGAAPSGSGGPFVGPAGSYVAAANRTWAGTISNAWGTAANWEEGAVPTTSDNTTIPASPTGAFDDPAISAGTQGVANMTIAAGRTVNQTGGTLQVAHAWRNSGVYNATGGTVQFTASAGGGADWSLGSGNNNQFFNVVVNSGIDPGFDNAANSRIAVAGDWTNNNAGLSLTGAVTTVTFDGTGAQTISGTATTFRNVTINKASGNVVLSGVDATVATATAATGTLTFTQGNIATGSNTLIIAAGGTVSRTSGHVEGNLRKFVNANGALARTFEIGTGTAYTPIVVNLANVSGSGTTDEVLTTSTTGADFGSIAASGVNPYKDVNRSWTLTKAGSWATTTYNATLNYVAGDLDPGANENNFVIRKLTGGTWSSPPGVSTPNAAGNQVTGTNFTTSASGTSETNVYVAGEAGTATATISGKVVNDANGNGVDNSEAGLAGAKVQLFHDTNGNGTYDAGTDLQEGSDVTTTATGTFSFGTLFGDTYFVLETNPAGYASTAAIAGTNGASVVNSDRIKVVLANATTSSGNEFLDQQRADHIDLSGSTANLASGTSRTITATIKDSAGNTLTTGSDSTLSVTFSQSGGTGSVTGLGSSSASGGIATINVTGGLAGSVSLHAAATGAGGAIASASDLSFTVVAGAAHHIDLTGSTGNLASGSARTVTATIKDAAGNTLTGDNTTVVTFAQTGGAGSVTGLGIATASSGVATKNVTGQTAGSVTLSATASGIPAGTTLTFTVVHGAAHHIDLTGSTSNLAAGSTRTVTATIKDAAGNTVTGDSSSVVTFAQTVGAGSVTGLGTSTASSGVASKIVTGQTAGSVTLSATASGVPAGTTLTFTVVAGTADHLAFGVQPSTTVAGQSIAPAVTARILDAFDNLVTTDSSTNVTVGFGNNAGGGTLSGTTTKQAATGVATFNDLSINKTGTGYTLAASSSPSLTGVTSSAFDITVAALDHIVISPSTSTITAGGSQSYTAEAFDQFDNSRGDVTSSTTFSIAPNGVGTGASCTGVSCTATKADLYTITGSYSGKSDDASLTVTNAAAAKLVFTPGPQTLNANQTSATITVRQQDVYGNEAPAGIGGRNVALTSNSFGGVFRDAANTMDITSVTIANGTSTASFRYRDSHSGTPTITGAETPDAGLTNATQTETIVALNQTIIIDTPAPAWAIYGASFDVAAHADSGLGVAITVTGGCSGSGTDTATITMTSGTTDCVVHYNQAGNATYDPASEITETVDAQLRPATWTTNPNSKVYGDDDPDPLTTGGGSNFLAADGVTATYSRAAGENVGHYHITASLSSTTFGALLNYSITNPGADFEITRATLTVTADPQSVTYGDAEPAYTFDVTGFVNSEDESSAAGYADPSCDSDYTNTTPVADSPRTIGCVAGAADNYVFDTSATADLTILTRQTQTVVTCDTPVHAGDSTTCTATVTDYDVGPKLDPLGTVQFSTDDISGTFSPGSTCTLDAGAADDTSSCSVTYSVSANEPAGSTHHIGAVYTPNDDIHAGSTATNFDLGVDTLANLHDLKTVDLDPVIAGNTLTYTILVTNNGLSDALGVYVTDIVPEGVTNARYCVPSLGSCASDPVDYTSYTTGAHIEIGTIAVGRNATVTFKVDVPSNTPDGTALTNSSTAHSLTPDSDASNNTGSVTSYVKGVADVSITKTAPASVSADDQLTYTITVTNESTSTTGSTAKGIQIHDDLQANTTFDSSLSSDGITCSEAPTDTITCVVPDIASGSSREVTITVDIPTTAGGTIGNTASVTSTTYDPSSGNDSSSSSTTVVAGAASAATSTITASPTSVSVDGSGSTITVQAKDQFGNDLTSGGDTVTLSASDSGSLTSVVDNGGGTYSATLTDTVVETVTVTGTINTAAIADDATVDFTAGAATHFTVAGFPSPTTAGALHSFTVTAKDQYGNTATGYVGTVQFSSSDAQAVLPANSTLTAGAGTFSATLKTAGSRSLTATDSSNSSITGTQSGIQVTASTATNLAISGLAASTTAGVSQGFTVTLRDQFGNVATGYTGTVQLGSNDGAATVPANYTFNGADAGTKSFSATFRTAGSRNLTATDTSNSTITDTKSILVNPASATYFTVTGLVNATAGTPQTATVTAYDAFNNVATGYVGTVHLTSTDAQAVLGPDSMLASGSGTFNVTLKTAGSQTVTATDTSVFTITGSETVTVTAGSLNKLGVTAPSSVVAGTPFNVTVTAQDAYGNTITGYAGTVHLTSSDVDSLVVLPADYTFNGGDQGVHTFTNGATLQTAGPQTITATDMVSFSVNGTANINVTPGSVLSDVATGDADWKGKIDGVDALFTKGAVSTQMKLKSTSPGSFHWRLTLQNETGLELHEKNVAIDAKNGGVVEMYLTLPSLPSNIGTPVPSGATQYQSPTRSAFVTESANAVHVKPDDKNDPGVDDLKFTLKYTTTLPSGNDCSQLPLTDAAWIGGQPADNTNVKCIYVRGLALKKHGKANIDVKLKSALLNVDGFASNAQNTFRAGFPFRSVTTITLDNTFPIASLAGKSYSGIQALGLVFAGKQVTAVGGYVFGVDGYGIQNTRVALWNSAAGATCAPASGVGWAATQSDGFYFIWNQGDNSSGPGADVTTNTLPSGMQYYVKVCDVPGIDPVNWPARSIDHKLGNKEFDEEDFFVSPSTQLQFSQQPVNKKVGTAFTVKVQVLDAFNQLVANENATQVTLALNASPGGGTFSCIGGPTATVSGGTATFTCSVGPSNAVAAKNYQLIATSNPVLKSTTSNFFDITR